MAAFATPHAVVPVSAFAVALHACHASHTVAVVGLAACGGGSGESEPAGLQAPSGFSVASYGPKTYNLGWTVTPGAMRYELFEDPDGAAGPQPESLFGVGAANNVTSFPIQVGGLLHERVNASYRLRACDASGCGSFTSAVTPDLTQAIGRFDLPAGDPTQRFGAYTNAIALSADGLTLAVGSPREGSSDGLAGAGAVYIFSRSMPGVGMPAPAWGLRARLEGSSPAAKMAFGASLALSANGRTLAVGAPEERSNARGINGDAANRDAYGAGAAYIFMDNGSTWSQQAYIKARNTAAKVETCSRLDISGTAVFPCTPNTLASAWLCQPTGPATTAAGPSRRTCQAAAPTRQWPALGRL